LLDENRVCRIYKFREVISSRIFQASRLLDSEGGTAVIAAVVTTQGIVSNEIEQMCDNHQDSKNDARKIQLPQRVG
jgi:hypothetical protein